MDTTQKSIEKNVTILKNANVISFGLITFLFYNKLVCFE